MPQWLSICRGAGNNAKIPASYTPRPFDPAIFGTEPSPSAMITDESMAEAKVPPLFLADPEATGALRLDLNQKMLTMPR